MIQKKKKNDKNADSPALRIYEYMYVCLFATLSTFFWLIHKLYINFQKRNKSIHKMIFCALPV